MVRGAHYTRQHPVPSRLLRRHSWVEEEGVPQTLGSVRFRGERCPWQLLGREGWYRGQSRGRGTVREGLNRDRRGTMVLSVPLSDALASFVPKVPSSRDPTAGTTHWFRFGKGGDGRGT